MAPRGIAVVCAALVCFNAIIVTSLHQEALEIAKKSFHGTVKIFEANNSSNNMLGFNETLTAPLIPYIAGDGFCSRGGEGGSRDTVINLWNRFDVSVCSKTTCMHSTALSHGVLISHLSAVKSPQATEIWKEVNPTAHCRTTSYTLPLNNTTDEIEISFIFTVHNSAAMAVQSIADVFSTIHEIAERTEIVLVDDASTEDMSSVFNLCTQIKELFGYPVTVIKSTVNKGFGASNNLALKAATGKYAMLLNSDILVNSGWLSALLYTMRTYPRAGMVGPMMLGADGLVKEAGGYIYRGGKPSNFGRKLKPDRVPYLYARPVDYISAACLLVRRQLFLDLGLFDKQFAPAYYEDTDAALVHLKAGYVTVLQPFAVVMHTEGASINSKLKDKLMEKNKKLFVKKHKAVVDNFCPAVESSCTKVSKKVTKLVGDTYSTFVRDGPHVLVLEKHIPKPDRDSGSLRLTEIFRIFQRLGYTVSLETLALPTIEDRYRVSLMAEGIYVHSVGMLQSLATQMDSGGGASVRCPWDVIYISKRDPWMMLGEIVKKICPNAPVIYDTVDVHFIREERQLQVNNNTNVAKIEANKKIELGFMARSDVNLVVSNYEEKVLNELNLNLTVRVLSNIYPRPARVDNIPLSSRNGAIFVGNLCHHPNRDALEFILRRLAKKIFKDGTIALKLIVVVSNYEKCPYRLVEKYTKKYNVELHRDVTDAELLALHNRARMLIAPLQYGAGVKGKVNYALLHGLPVVGTYVAVEGMHMHNGRSVLSAESANEFIDAMLQLSTDDRLWHKLQEGGWKIMVRYFTINVAVRALTKTLTENLKLPLPVWGSLARNPAPNLRACKRPASFTLPSACKGCWHCAKNPNFFIPPVHYGDFYRGNVTVKKDKQTPVASADVKIV